MSMQNTAQNLKLDEHKHVENAARSTYQQAHGDGSAKRHGACKLMIHNKIPPEPTEILLYQTKDGQTRLEVCLQEETVWLTQMRMAELFQKNVRTINEHIQNIFAEGELASESVIRKFRITAEHGIRGAEYER